MNSKIAKNIILSYLMGLEVPSREYSNNEKRSNEQFSNIKKLIQASLVQQQRSSNILANNANHKPRLSFSQSL